MKIISSFAHPKWLVLLKEDLELTLKFLSLRIIPLILKENFFEFLQNLIFDYKDKVLNTELKLSGGTFENFPIFIDLLVENKPAGICDMDENFKLEEGMNLLLLKILETFKNKIKSNNSD